MKFKKAIAVFPAGRSREQNVCAVFRATVDDLRGAKLVVTASSFYRAEVNGKFVGFGPARTAKGYARADVLALDAYAKDGENEIVITVVNHYCKSLSLVKQAGFVQAEVVRGGKAILWTGRDFEAFIPASKVQKVDRYSYQRHFSEVWDFRAGGLLDGAEPTETEAIQNPPTVIDRRAPYPDYTEVSAECIASRGTLTVREDEIETWYINPLEKRHMTAVWGIFPREEILYHPREWIAQRQQNRTGGKAAFPLTLGENEYAVIDLSRVETGFIRFDATAKSDADLIVAFSEESEPDRFFFTNIRANNAVEVLAGKDKPLSFQSFEPYVFRWAIVAVKSGSVTLNGFGVKRFAHETASVKLPDFKDATLNSVYRAAVNTFAHNAVDIYMDCPSRERAGWLCDSFFTGKTEYALFGKHEVEDAFLENYRLFPNGGEYPDGMIPMCYPSEMELNGNYIPQWSMWYLLELEEYLNIRAPKEDRELFRASVDGLLRFYKKYENKDGLLEDLPQWNFVEWSKANKWTKNVNYPTNFLYAEVLERVSRIYGDESLVKKAEKIRKKTIAQSFDGSLFHDHALRGEDGKLTLAEDISEIGQYYAILFGGFDLNEKRFAKLKDLVLHTFSADRPADVMPEIEVINAFIGVYLRLEALMKIGEKELALSDVRSFFGEMEAETGTLWEYRQHSGSRDHGFASYAAVVIKNCTK